MQLYVDLSANSWNLRVFFKAKNEKLVKTMFASEILLIFNSFKIIGSHLKKVIPCKNCAAHSELSLTNNGLFRAKKIFI